MGYSDSPLALNRSCFRKPDRMNKRFKVSFGVEAALCLGPDDDVRRGWCVIPIDLQTLPLWYEKPWFGACEHYVDPFHAWPVELCRDPFVQRAELISKRRLNALAFQPPDDALFLMQMPLDDVGGGGQSDTERHANWERYAPLDQHPHDDPRADDENGESEYPSPSSPDRDAEGQPPPLDVNDQLVVIYQLNAEPRRIFMPVNSYEDMIVRTAQALGIRADRIVWLWKVSVLLQGEVEFAHAYILQKVGDVPLGGPSKLVIIDYEVHGIDAVLSIPQNSRSIPTLNRQHVLRLVHADAYCERERDRCLVHADNQIWPHQERANRRIGHGLYLRVTIPAPERLRCDVSETQDAVNLAQLEARSNSSESMTEPSLSELLEDLSADEMSSLQIPSQTGFRVTDQFHADPSDLCDDLPEVEAPRALPIDLADENFQDIRRVWEQYAAISHVEQGPVATFMTFYLTADWFTICEHGRFVEFDANAMDWLRVLAEAWEDVIDRAYTIDVWLVRPRPPTSAMMHAAGFLILVQRPLPQLHACLIAARHAADDIQYKAHMLPLAIDRSRLLSRQGLDPFCYRRHREQCRAWYHDIELHDGHDMRTFNGQAFVIVLQPDQRPDPATVELSWSAIGSRSDHEDAETENASSEASESERLTDDSVAHGRRPDSVDAQRRVLSLDALCSPPVLVQIALPHVLCLRNQLSMVELGPHFDMNTLVRWHDATWNYCEHIPYWQGERPLSFHFFTDGSATESDSAPAAAAAVFLVVWTDGGWRLAGFRSATIVDNATAPYAENAAIYLALLWLIGIDSTWPGVVAGTTVHFGFDSQVAGQSAAGVWQMKRPFDVARMNRSVVHWLTGRFACTFDWFHIKSHTGHPMNEAADAIAWATACRWIQTIAFEEVVAFTTMEGRFTNEFEWLWFLERSLAGGCDCPSLHGTVLQVNVATPFETPPSADHHDFVIAHKEPLAPTPLVQARQRLKFVTANVLYVDDFWRRKRSMMWLPSIAKLPVFVKNMVLCSVSRLRMMPLLAPFPVTYAMRPSPRSRGSQPTNGRSTTFVAKNVST
eukprot:Skav218926  [mRNA]  locus=scaffold2031:191810:198140:+ [translate_table: standard]